MYAATLPRPGLLLGAVLLLAGCASSRPPADALPHDLPDRFVVGAHDSEATSLPRPGEGCRNPMIDPRDGARLLLVRSTAHRGDYQTPADRYGLVRGELLRIDCATGKAVGIIRR